MQNRMSENLMKYKIFDNKGASVTIFVPWDCKNSCRFCINKKEYKNTKDFSLESIIESFNVLHKISPNCNIVITGGEPLADLKSLEKILIAIPNSHNIYINTSIPETDKIKLKDIWAFFNKYKTKITYLNVSRHMDKILNECPDAIFKDFPVPIRLNCVLYKEYTEKDFKNYIERFKPYNLPIQFRANYMEVPEEKVRVIEEDVTSEILSNLFLKEKVTNDIVRYNFHYLTEYGNKVVYHVTLPYTLTKIVKNNNVYNALYDIIIKQNGEIHADWDGTPLILESYKNLAYVDKYK